MITCLAVQLVEIIVGIIVAIVLVGGFGAYAIYKRWAKKHSKSPCGGDCIGCQSCSMYDDCHIKSKNNTSKKSKADGNIQDIINNGSADKKE